MQNISKSIPSVISKAKFFKPILNRFKASKSFNLSNFHSPVFSTGGIFSSYRPKGSILVSLDKRTFCTKNTNLFKPEESQKNINNLKKIPLPTDKNEYGIQTCTIEEWNALKLEPLSKEVQANLLKGLIEYNKSRASGGSVY